MQVSEYRTNPLSKKADTHYFVAPGNVELFSVLYMNNGPPESP